MRNHWIVDMVPRAETDDFAIFCVIYRTLSETQWIRTVVSENTSEGTYPVVKLMECDRLFSDSVYEEGVIVREWIVRRKTELVNIEVRRCWRKWSVRRGKDWLRVRFVFECSWVRCVWVQEARPMGFEDIGRHRDAFGKLSS